MRWLLVCAFVSIGCAGSAPALHRNEISDLDTKYANHTAPAAESFAAFRSPLLLREVGEWALYRLTAADGEHAYETLELIGADGCGTWITSEVINEYSKQKRYLCLKHSSSREASDQVARVMYQSDGGTPVTMDYRYAADKRDDIGSIANRMFLPERAVNGTDANGVRYELLDRGKNDHPRSELASLANRLTTKTLGSEKDGPLFTRRISLGVSGAMGVTAPHGGADARGVMGAGVDAFIHLTPTLELIDSLRWYEEHYDVGDHTRSRSRAMFGFGLRWSPQMQDSSLFLTRGFYVRSTIGSSSIVDSGLDDSGPSGLGIETAIGLRVFSRHGETAFGYELAHNMSVFSDAGVEHVLALRLSIDIGGFWPW